MSKILPKDITKDSDSGKQYASFGYYDGISLVKEKNMKQATSFSDLDDGNHFIVCCGDVMISVKEEEYPEIERRML